ncbi:MAG TPA: IPT/TIG domain-containing protein [Bryobacteraceae bacterium]|nr:IPT/TIG domain-containing protein [Bryobacteraceae bacterium]
MPLQIRPKTIALRARETQAFQAAGTAGTVTWSIQPRSGQIDGNGVYTAPKLVARNTNVTVQAHDGTQFDAANVTLDPGWFWLHLLGVYWLAWAALLLAVLLGGWQRVCPNCRPAELLISPPLATVTASQPVRFTATAPVTWQDNLNSGGLYNTPPAAPPNASIDITATAIADPKKFASASLIWSSDIGITLQPQQSIVFGEGHVDFNAILTAAPDKQGKIDLSTAVVAWVQPPIGSILAGPNGTATYRARPGEIKRAATIMIMANVQAPGVPPRPAGTYLTLLPQSPAKACQEDGTPSTASLIALIALAGALGGLIHGASSFAIFAGNRQFKSSWTWWYVLRPLLGAAVALVVYLVVRSGMGTGDWALAGADCLKTAGFAGLIGMFAEPAMLKLKDIFNTIFTPRDDPRKDELNPEQSPPRINSIDPPSVSSAEPPATLQIAGANFVAGCVVKIGANVRGPRSVTPGLLEVELQAHDVAAPGEVPIRVCNTPNDSDCSNTVNLKVT